MPTAVPTKASTVAALPATLALTGLGQPSDQSFSVSEPGYTGGFTVSAPNCVAIVSIAAGAANQFIVTPEAAGSCTATVADMSGETVTLPIGVTVLHVGGS